VFLLVNATVVEDHSRYQAGDSRWDWSFVLADPVQTSVESFIVVGVRESGSAERFPAKGAFSALLCCDHVEGWPVLVAAGEHRPGDTRNLVGHGDHDDVLVSSASSRSSQSPIGNLSRLIRSTAVRAPWIRILRRYTFPYQLMPSSLALPPVGCCRGTMPNQAANSRLLRKAAPLPIAATIAVATTGPMPGICRMRVQPGSAAEIRSSFVAELLHLLLDGLPLTPQRADQVAHPRRQVGFSVLKDLRHGGLQLGRLLSEHHAALQQKCP